MTTTITMQPSQAAQHKPLRIGLIVGETSGAIIALGMVKQLRIIYPDCEIVGIGSESLVKLGMKSLFDMNELSIMGLVEVLKHLPRLLHIRKTIVRYFLDNPPDVFIGVDAPDFNLRVESDLKAAGIPTVHYVSPTVWAWREKRIYKIAKATNLVLGIFPFEQAIYQKYKVPFQFVGHTMADDIPLEVDQLAARKKLGIEVHNSDSDTLEHQPIIALLPGSRTREIASLLDIFLATFIELQAKTPNIKAIIPAVNDDREIQIKDILSHRKLDNAVTVTRASARDVMIAADAVLLASGTAALEALLCKRPMVVAYIMSGMTHMMMKRMYKPKYFSLPNILANELIVPEFLQEDVNAPNLAAHLYKVWKQDSATTQKLMQRFTDIHKSLGKNADVESAKAVLSLIGRYPKQADVSKPTMAQPLSGNINE